MSERSTEESRRDDMSTLNQDSIDEAINKLNAIILSRQKLSFSPKELLISGEVRQRLFELGYETKEQIATLIDKEKQIRAKLRGGEVAYSTLIEPEEKSSA